MSFKLLRIGSKVFTTLAVGKVNRKEYADPYILIRLCLRSMKFLNLEQAEISNPKLFTAKQKANQMGGIADNVFVLPVIISFQYNNSL